MSVCLCVCVCVCVCLRLSQTAIKKRDPDWWNTARRGGDIEGTSGRKTLGQGFPRTTSGVALPGLRLREHLGVTGSGLSDSCRVWPVLWNPAGYKNTAGYMCSCAAKMLLLTFTADSLFRL